MPTVREVRDFDPICPHCDQVVHEFVAVRLPATFGKRYAYCCSHCRKVLGVSHRKGFWMG